MKYQGSELEIFQNVENWKKYWSGLITESPVATALEVGAGIGGNLPYLLHKSKMLTLLEPDSEYCLNQLKQNLHLYSGVKVVNGTLQAILEQDNFDTIYYIDVLEHIENDLLELEIASSHLKIGGRIYILVPAHMFLFSQFDQSVGHYRRYSRKSLQNCIPKNLVTRRVKNLDCVGLFASLLNKYLFPNNLVTRKKVVFWDRFVVPMSVVLDQLLLFRVGKSIFVELERIH